LGRATGDYTEAVEQQDDDDDKRRKQDRRVDQIKAITGWGGAFAQSYIDGPNGVWPPIPA
jgi:hypothetical protein